MQHFTLSNGVIIPAVGFGTAAIGSWQQDDDYVYNIVLAGIKAGYRHLDTASLYGNERSVGRAIKDSGITRNEFFITTKVWDNEQGYKETLAAMERSLARLQLDYVDLYLIHWPLPKKTKDTWHAMETLHERGKIRSLGLSNFRKADIDHLLTFAKTKPVYNQLEIHPYFNQSELCQYCKTRNIYVACWSPLGTGTWSGVNINEKPILDPVVLKIAEKYGVGSGQIILKWDLQQGRIVLPKAESAHNIKNNLNLFSFELNDSELAAITALNKNCRFGGDPSSGYAQRLNMKVPD